jgi:acid phosphatase type 7
MVMVKGPPRIVKGRAATAAPLGSVGVKLAVVLGLTAGCTARTVGPEAANDTPTLPPPTASAEASRIPDTAVPSPSTTPTAVPTPAVLIAAGDVASCHGQGDEATAALIDGLSGTVAMLGDSAYDRGDPQEFADCYDPSWGRFKSRTRPAVGNHEYLTAGAEGYFDYFGPAAGDPAAGYYSYDLGAWHAVALNSQCWEVGGCGAEDPQALWLKADLASRPTLCTLAYWHVPRYSSGIHGSSDLVDAYWDLLYQAGVDVVLTGHDHDYERFAPQDDQGRADPERGLREFVVGTGGFSHYPFPGVPIANSEVRNASSFGVLVLTLYEDRYEWQFLPAAGQAFTDSGTTACHP